MPNRPSDAELLARAEYVKKMRYWDLTVGGILDALAERLRAVQSILTAADRQRFHMTYNGGYTHEGMDKERAAFHHGMDTVFNAIEARAAQSGVLSGRPTHDRVSGTAGGSPADSVPPAAPPIPGPTVRDVEEVYGLRAQADPLSAHHGVAYVAPRDGPHGVAAPSEPNAAESSETLATSRVGDATRLPGSAVPSVPLVCVCCGAPWEPAVKNRCECGGFCTRGYSKGGRALSWRDDGTPNPPPAAPSTPVPYGDAEHPGDVEAPDAPTGNPVEPTATDPEAEGWADLAARARASWAGEDDAPEFDALLRLPTNWDSYGAPPIDAKTIERARAWLGAVSVVPTCKGGVALEWYRDGVELEVIFSPDDPVTPEVVGWYVAALPLTAEALAKHAPRLWRRHRGFGVTCRCGVRLYPANRPGYTREEADLAWAAHALSAAQGEKP